MGRSRAPRIQLNRLWPCLAVCLMLVTPAHGVIVRQETVTASEDGTSPLVTPIIPDGTDQTYVLFVATRRNDDVTSVTGAGLTWTEQVEQCGGRDQQGIRLWTAQGSPVGPFAVTVNYDDSSPHPIVADRRMTA